MPAVFQPVRGVRDFYPEDLRLRDWLFERWRSGGKKFGFVEYDACVLEHEDLYLRKAGEEIAEQIYGFTDKGGRRLSLRPEMTPSLARLVVQRQGALSFPLKWFSVAQCFRYERMTRGRRREHYQWNADIVGESSLVAEVEILALLFSVLADLGLSPKHVRVHLNHRQLMRGLLRTLGILDIKHAAVLSAIDKRDKVTTTELTSMLHLQGLDERCGQSLLEVLNNNDHQRLCQMVAGKEEAAAFKELDWLMARLADMGFADWCQLDLTVVRGLSYYTGTVFEIRDANVSLRAICGGGRYDNLLETVGGKPMSAVGFGFGDIVIMELLQEQKLLPVLTNQHDCLVIPYSKAEHDACFSISQKLRQRGLSTYAELSGRKLPRSLQLAEAIGAKYAILLMPEELARGRLIIKNLAERQETLVEMEAFLAEPNLQ